jgi:hypothetical protein
MSDTFCACLCYTKALRLETRRPKTSTCETQTVNSFVTQRRFLRQEWSTAVPELRVAKRNRNKDIYNLTGQSKA